MSRARRGTGEHDGDSGPLPASQPGYREGTALSARHGPDVRTDGGRVVERSDVLSGRSAAGESGAWHTGGEGQGMYHCDLREIKTGRFDIGPASKGFCCDKAYQVCLLLLI